MIWHGVRKAQPNCYIWNYKNKKTQKNKPQNKKERRNTTNKPPSTSCLTKWLTMLNHKAQDFRNFFSHTITLFLYCNSPRNNAVIQYSPESFTISLLVMPPQMRRGYHPNWSQKGVTYTHTQSLTAVSNNFLS